MFKSPINPEHGFITVDGEPVAVSIFRTRRRKRTMAYKMDRDASLRVLAPYSASVGSVIKMLQRHTAWIVREREDRKKRQTHNDFTDGSIFPYLGRPYILHVTQGDQQERGCRLSPHALHIHIPNERLSDKDLRQEVRLELLLWLKKRAKVKLQRRLDFWAGRMDLVYKKFILSSPERRWGSCSHDNIIRLNWRLIMAPLPILDYVAAHELSHVRHKNHSDRFWDFLAQVMPDSKARRQVLRQIESTLLL